ncbi:MAG: hypothetical protein WBQ48_02110, partial [Aeromicrobium sp.]
EQSLPACPGVSQVSALAGAALVALAPDLQGEDQITCHYNSEADSFVSVNLFVKLGGSAEYAIVETGSTPSRKTSLSLDRSQAQATKHCLSSTPIKVASNP